VQPHARDAAAPPQRTPNACAASGRCSPCSPSEHSTLGPTSSRRRPSQRRAFFHIPTTTQAHGTGTQARHVGRSVDCLRLPESQARPSPPVAAAKETTPQEASGSHTLKSGLPHNSPEPHLDVHLRIGCAHASGGEGRRQLRLALPAGSALCRSKSHTQLRRPPPQLPLVRGVRRCTLRTRAPAAPACSRSASDAAAPAHLATSELDEARCAARQPLKWTFGASAAPSPP